MKKLPAITLLAVLVAGTAGLSACGGSAGGGGDVAAAAPSPAPAPAQGQPPVSPAPVQASAPSAIFVAALAEVTAPAASDCQRLTSPRLDLAQLDLSNSGVKAILEELMLVDLPMR